MRYNDEDEQRFDRRRRGTNPVREEKRKGNKGEMKESFMSHEDDDDLWIPEDSSERR